MTTLNTSARRYTLAEIDRMRNALWSVSPYQHHYYSSMYYGNGNVCDQQHAENQRWAAHKSSIEDELRTCMMGGVGADELEEKAEAAISKRAAQVAKAEAECEERRLRSEYGPRE